MDTTISDANNRKIKQRKKGKKRGPKPKGKRKTKIPVKRWKSLSPPHTVGRMEFSYSDIPYCEQFVNPAKYLPLIGDLVVLILEGGREVKGWWNGSFWQSWKLRGRKVVGWKRELYKIRD